MANTRYGNTPIIGTSGEPIHYGTFDLPDHVKGLAEIDLLDGTETTKYTFQHGDRLDKLSNRYYGDDEYWWVIALVNKITYPLGITPGTELIIPLDIIPVLRTLEIL